MPEDKDYESPVMKAKKLEESRRETHEFSNKYEERISRTSKKEENRDK